MDVWYGITLTVLFLEFTTSLVQKESVWTVHNEIKNRLFTGTIFTSTEHSVISCVIACARYPCCLFVTYTSSSGSCRGHNEVFNTTSSFTYYEGTTAFYTKSRQVMKYNYLESGKVCFSIKVETKTWSEAAKSCQTEGTDLLILDTLEKHHALATYLNNYPAFNIRFWIGGSDLDVEGKWLWVDGTEVSMSKDFWNIDEPNNCCGGEDCLILSAQTNRGWNDAQCINRRGYICGFEV